MKRLTLIVFAVVLLSTCGAGPARSEEVILYWDDGVCGPPCEHTTSGRLGQRLVVSFTAPEWANWLVAVQYHQICDPGGFEVPDMPFTVVVHRPAEGAPAPPGAQVLSEELCIGPHPPPPCTDDFWFEWRLENPVPLEDHEVFPGRVFFAGLEWIYRLAPDIPYDVDAPIAGHSWFFDWSEWSQFPEGDVMIRAVVADSIASVVTPASWGVVKALYR